MVRLEVGEESIIAALAHLVIAALQVTSSAQIADILLESIQSEGNVLLEDPIEGLLLPILYQVAGEMRDICSDDCKRVSTGRRSTFVGYEDPIRIYWRRLDPTGTIAKPTINADLVIEKGDATCKVGFPVDLDHMCPLFDRSFELAPSNIEHLLSVVKEVVEFRLTQAQQRAIVDRDAAMRRNKAAGSDFDEVP